MTKLKLYAPALLVIPLAPFIVLFTGFLIVGGILGEMFGEPDLNSH